MNYKVEDYNKVDCPSGSCAGCAFDTSEECLVSKDERFDCFGANPWSNCVIFVRKARVTDEISRDSLSAHSAGNNTAFSANYG